MISGQAILIPSCDNYQDLWQPFFHLFFKNWPDCPYPIYLGSNRKKYTHGGKVKNLTTGHDFGWAENLEKYLQQLEETYLFVWPDDAFVTSVVDSKRFENYFRLMRTYKAKHIHFRCLPKPERLVENGTLGIYPKGIPYSVNMAGFWDRRYLTHLLMAGESPWNFEIMGSYRASYDDGFYCLAQPLFRFIHLSEKGKWNRTAVKYCQTHNINIDLSRREFSTHDYFHTVKNMYFNFFINKNWRLRVAVMNFLRRLLISY